MASLETNLNNSPYFQTDDHITKNYHQVLFKPSVAVQTRELNELQAILQKQIERFGDAVYKRGTIISGCGFSYFNEYPYVKIFDNEQDGTPAIPALYVGKFAKNSANVQAYIVNYQDGFESSDPDLKTLYFNYMNSGDDNQTNSFSAGDILTVYDSNNSLYAVVVNDGSLGFSNTDAVIVTPAVAVNVSSGTFSNGDYLVIPATGANLEIVEADYLSLANSNQVLLKVQPRDVDLANGDANSTMWTLVQDAAVTDASATVSGTIENIYGTGAVANVTTFATGKVTDISILSGGGDYFYEPQVRIRSIDNAAGLATLDLAAQNYLAKLQVSAAANSVGFGYAFGIGEGVIWQKGFFVRVSPQIIIVDKYNNQPNNVVVGFDTLEEIINSNIDPDLLDNALGTQNETAPGADRLKLTPTLRVLSYEEAAANNDFYVLSEWNEGQPYKQNQPTAYSRLGEELAKRQFDSTGNFVVDTFQTNIQSPANTQVSGKYYTATIDPGQAYISGYKVQTRRNYNINVTKGIDTEIANSSISLNYGNYIRVNDLAGLFLFSTGDTVSLRDTVSNFKSNSELVELGNINPSGSEIGTARIRSLTLNNTNVRGAAGPQYRMYLFDIKMNQGKNFANVRSVFYTGTTANGVCDTWTTPDPTTNKPIVTLYERKDNKLLFNAGVESLKNSNNTTYTYRTVDPDAETSNSGLLSYSIASNPNEFFPYNSGVDLTDFNMRDLLVIPTSNNLIAFQNATGTVAVGTSSNVITDVTATAFNTDFAVGDFVYVEESGVNNAILRITSIANSTQIQVDRNVGFTNATGVPIYRCWPKNIPIPFGMREGLSANVNAGRTVVTLNLNQTLRGTTNTITTLGMNINREGITSSSKTSTRNRYVKIRTANAIGGTTGPWCLGVSDAMRLRRVFVHTADTVNVNSLDITSEFYIDHNQNANYLDLSYLYKKPSSRKTLTSSDYLLCEFDYFVRDSEGYYDTVSYLGTSNSELIYTQESLPLSNLTSFASYWEIPEVYTSEDKYYDLIQNYDFRPAAAQTAQPNTAPANAPLNPEETLSFGNTADPTNSAKFPLPGSNFRTTNEYYLGRIDHICMSGIKGNIFVLKGVPAADPRKRYEPNHPKDSLKLQVINVPAYPNLPNFLDVQHGELISTHIGNEKFMQLRRKSHAIAPFMSSDEMQLTQPMVYTMEDIGNLERRIRDLEYYVSLSVLETSITNKQIPSSVDGTLNRFKFGFIADDFESELYTDSDNPQYAASKLREGDYTFGQYKSPMEPNQAANTRDPETKSIFSSTKLSKKVTPRIYPPVFPWMMKHYCDNTDYTDYLVVEQINATDTDSGCEIGTFSGNGEFGNYTVTVDFFSQDVRTDYLTFGSNVGQVTMYFYNFGGGDKYDIYQGGKLVASTNAAANAVVTLTDADRAFLSTNTVASEFWGAGEAGVDLSKDFVRDTANNDFVKWAGKITFTHNPNEIVPQAGSAKKHLPGVDQGPQSYKIVTTKGPGSSAYRYLIRYPQDTGDNQQIVNPCNPPPVTIYNGGCGTDIWHQWACSKNLNVGGQRFQKIRLYGFGLKPNTRHFFYLDGVENSEDVKPEGKQLGAPIITNDEGKVTFDFFIDETWLNKIKGPGGQYIFDKWSYTPVFGSTGYTLFELAARGSSCKILIANRAPTKLLKGGLGT
jgi:hypothetical protein